MTKDLIIVKEKEANQPTDNAENDVYTVQFARLSSDSALASVLNRTPISRLPETCVMAHGTLTTDDTPVVPSKEDAISIAKEALHKGHEELQEHGFGPKTPIYVLPLEGTVNHVNG